MSGADGNDAILVGALRDFLAFWERTAAVWRDSARARFEAEVLRELVDAIHAAAASTGQIEQLLSRIRRECS